MYGSGEPSSLLLASPRSARLCKLELELAPLFALSTISITSLSGDGVSCLLDTESLGVKVCSFGFRWAPVECWVLEVAAAGGDAILVSLAATGKGGGGIVEHSKVVLGTKVLGASTPLNASEWSSGRLSGVVARWADGFGDGADLRPPDALLPAPLCLLSFVVGADAAELVLRVFRRVSRGIGWFLRGIVGVQYFDNESSEVE